MYFFYLSKYAWFVLRFEIGVGLALYQVNLVAKGIRRGTKLNYIWNILPLYWIWWEAQAFWVSFYKWRISFPNWCQPGLSPGPNEKTKKGVLPKKKKRSPCSDFPTYFTPYHMSPFLFVPRTIVSLMVNVNGIGIFRAACWPLEEKSRLNDENFKVEIFFFS